MKMGDELMERMESTGRTSNHTMIEKLNYGCIREGLQRLAVLRGAQTLAVSERGCIRDELSHERGSIRTHHTHEVFEILH